MRIGAPLSGTTYELNDPGRTQAGDAFNTSCIDTCGRKIPEQTLTPLIFSNPCEDRDIQSKCRRKDRYVTAGPPGCMPIVAFAEISDDKIKGQITSGEKSRPLSATS